MEYVNARTKVCIICPEHGRFYQMPNSHLSGYKCRKCGGRRSKTTEDFIIDSKKVHGDRYDYSDSVYVNSRTPVVINCSKHGLFFQKANYHLSGNGCPSCGSMKQRAKERRSDMLKNISPDGYKYIPLTQGKYSIVDSSDYELLIKFNWSLVHNYAYNKSVGRMHRYIMDCPEGMVVDHINHDTLDNRRCNLRICTHHENMMNSRSKTGSSTYKGVSMCAELNKWRSRIRYNNKNIHLGYFDNEKDAAIAYDKKAVEIYGEFAYLNIPIYWSLTKPLEEK